MGSLAELSKEGAATLSSLQEAIYPVCALQKTGSRKPTEEHEPPYKKAILGSSEFPAHGPTRSDCRIRSDANAALDRYRLDDTKAMLAFCPVGQKAGGAWSHTLYCATVWTKVSCISEEGGVIIKLAIAGNGVFKTALFELESILFHYKLAVKTIIAVQLARTS